MAFSPETYGAVQSLIEASMTGAGAIKGQDGAPGKSAYELAKINGFDGTEQEWLDSLVGEEGKSAYETAKDNGFDGTEEEWLQSLTMERTLSLADYEALSEEEKNNGVTYYIEDGEIEESLDERITIAEQDIIDLKNRTVVNEDSIAVLQIAVDTLATAATYICDNLT